jgi:type 1 fimbriae regulatory protein FimB/type 1 fimbriae regulatory protein FimE
MMRESNDMAATSQLSFSVKRPPNKPTNAGRRSREYLTPHEVDQVIAAARKMGRHSGRNAALILLMYSHGLRVAEAVALRWDAVNVQTDLLHVHRVKNGEPTVHPLRGPELRYSLLCCGQGKLQGSHFRFIPICCGMPAVFYMADKAIDTRAIQQYLGHRNIQHTVRYTALTPHRFTDFWGD